MINTILLQAQSSPSGNMGTLIMLGGVAIIFYFFMIRPQQKKQKAQKIFISEIKKGDKVVTIGGVHGKVTATDEHTVTIDIDRGTKITFERSSISQEASKRVNENA